MATGTIAEYDEKKRQGYIRPDSDADDEDLPFELDDGSSSSVHEGERVSYDVEGGLAGVMAINVRRLE